MVFWILRILCPGLLAGFPKLQSLEPHTRFSDDRFCKEKNCSCSDRSSTNLYLASVALSLLSMARDAAHGSLYSPQRFLHLFGYVAHTGVD